MGTPRPIVIIDTSVFLTDALSTTRKGAASQVLRALPAIAHVVLSDEIRAELLEKAQDRLGWDESDVERLYGPIFEVARWITPVDQTEAHLKVVNRDPDDTMLPRTAEAVWTAAEDLIEAGQEHFVVSENTRDLKPGTSYAGFLFVNSRMLLAKLD